VAEIFNFRNKNYGPATIFKLKPDPTEFLISEIKIMDQRYLKPDRRNYTMQDIHAVKIQKLWRNHICKRALHAERYLQISFGGCKQIFINNCYVKTLTRDCFKLLRWRLPRHVKFEGHIVYLARYFTKQCRFPDYKTQEITLLARDFMILFHEVLAAFRAKVLPSVALCQSLADVTVQIANSYTDWYQFHTELGVTFIKTARILYETKQHFDNTRDIFEEASVNEINMKNASNEVKSMIKELLKVITFQRFRTQIMEVEMNVKKNYKKHEPFTSDIYDVTSEVKKLRFIMQHLFKFMWKGN
jgi:hypothetical protein